MRLIRGWESRFVPSATGRLRLSKASLYRAIGEEEGLGDQREGEVRITQEGMMISWKDEVPPIPLGEYLGEPVDAEMAEEVRARLAEKLDDPELRLEPQESGALKIWHNAKVDDSELDSPYLFCLSREPTTKREWERLQAALPERYDTWTVIDDMESLYFEIEWGIKRWLGLNEITLHNLVRNRGWVAYTYQEIPISGELAEIGRLMRWFQKRWRYHDQEEYRLACLLSTPQWAKLPDAIEIELTRTGIGLFRPWTPPAC